MRVGGLDAVRYRSRKPPAAWRGSPAEKVADLDKLTGRTVLYRGTRRRSRACSIRKMPMLPPRWRLPAWVLRKPRSNWSPIREAPGNVHEIEAEGAAGRFAIQLQGQAVALPTRKPRRWRRLVLRGRSSISMQRSSYDCSDATRHQLPSSAVRSSGWRICASSPAAANTSTICQRRQNAARGDPAQLGRAWPHSRHRCGGSARAAGRSCRYHRRRHWRRADHSFAPRPAASRSALRAADHRHRQGPLMSAKPIAVVVADSIALAEDALEAIAVDIEPLAGCGRSRAARRGETVMLFEETGIAIFAGTITATRGDDIEAAFQVRALHDGREHFQRAAPRRGADGAARPRSPIGTTTRQRITVSGACKVPFTNRRALAADDGSAGNSVRRSNTMLAAASARAANSIPRIFSFRLRRRFSAVR